MSEQRYNIDEVWPHPRTQDLDQFPLPSPTASMPKEIPEKGVTKSELTGMRCNPAYTGAIYSFPKIIDRERWVYAAARCIRAEGPEQFLVNLLAMLDHSKSRQMLRGVGMPELQQAINQQKKEKP